MKLDFVCTIAILLLANSSSQTGKIIFKEFVAKYHAYSLVI